MSIGRVGTSFGSSYFISASGLMDASLRMAVSANNVANANTGGFVPDQVDSVAQTGGGVRGLVVLGNAGMLTDTTAPSQTDYATEAVNMTLAKQAFQADAKVIQAQARTEESLMDVLA